MNLISFKKVMPWYDPTSYKNNVGTHNHVSLQKFWPLLARIYNRAMLFQAPITNWRQHYIYKSTAPFGSGA
jgi:hypothetical protein